MNKLYMYNNLNQQYFTHFGQNILILLMEIHSLEGYGTLLKKFEGKW